MDNVIQPLIERAAKGQNLSEDEAARAFQVIMNGGATPAQMAAFLVALRLKGETVDEITGGAAAIRAKAAPFSAPEGTMDTCGTGGDNKGTLNVSTAVALVLAGCGVPVAKHGNRAVSSKSGSADVLSALDVKIDADAATMEKSLREINFCFLFAPLYHKAMRHVAPVRQELGLRTIFNLLGPLSNPAVPRRQLLGVYDAKWVEPMAHVLHKLGAERALVVHGHDGMDELTLTGPSSAAELKDGKVHTYEITPEDAGLGRADAGALKGGDAAHNAAAIRKLLLGEKTPYRDAVFYNTAAALVIAGKAADIMEGAGLAAEAIDSGAANSVLQKFILLTHAHADA